MKRRGGRKRALGTRRRMSIPDGANQRWSLDFISDAFTDGRRFRILAVVDDFTRECLALVPDTSTSGARVARVLHNGTELDTRNNLPGPVFLWFTSPEAAGSWSMEQRSLFGLTARTAIRWRSSMRRWISNISATGWSRVLAMVTGQRAGGRPLIPSP